MKQLYNQALRTLTLLEERRYILNELADKLCVCERHVQRVLRYLKANGVSIKSRIEGCIKYFWTTSNTDLLPAILTSSERLALGNALTQQNTDLKTAMCKLTQLTSVKLHLHAQR